MDPREYARKSGSGVDGAPLAKTKQQYEKQTIARLERAALRLTSAEASLEGEVKAAHYYGMSLRQIAKHAGMSHEKVRGLISQDQT